MHVVAKTMRMLIGYASRFGSTRDIAIRIADTVRARGYLVDVRSVDEISNFDPYDAVVLEVVYTTDRGRQKRRTWCVGTRQCSRESPCGCSASDLSAIDIRLSADCSRKSPRSSASSSSRFALATIASLRESLISITGPHGDGSCSKPSAGTRAITASGLTSMRGQKRSRMSLEPRTESRPRVTRWALT